MLPDVAAEAWFFAHVAASLAVALLVYRRASSNYRAALAIGALLMAGLIQSVLFGPSMGHGPFGSLLLLAWTGFVALPLACFGLAIALRARRLRMVLSLAGVLLIGVAVWSFGVEPRWLEVSTHQVRSEKIERPIRVAVVADLQTDAPGEYERSVLQELRAAKPDLVLFAGDYIQQRDPAAYRESWESLRAIIVEADLHPPLGMFAVRGDVEHGHWYAELEGTGITPVVGGRAQFEFDDAGIVVTALGLAESNRPSAPISGPTDGRFHITFGHRPDFALDDVEADLLLAGHTHGGQVQLPFLGPVITLSRVPRSWAAGRVTRPDGSTLIVSRGVGMERGAAPRLRFGCRPELVIVDLVPQ